jgi:RNA polymerase sigma factor (sigma-70 family)
MVQQINDELGWNLSLEKQQIYTAHISTYLPKNCSDKKLRTIIICYHEDHLLVQALCDRQHQAHDTVWTAWTTRVAAILQSAGLIWSSDPAIDSDDLVQIAQSELVRSITKFQYHSRFSTWAYRVVVQSVQRSIRDSRALKRATRPDSLQQLTEGETPYYNEDYLEAHTAGQLLLERIGALLAAHPDDRLGFIFWLWAVSERTSEEIGQMIQLHPSRVRTLLVQARTLLRNHPDICRWDDPTEI